jgi:hypothetical protein
MKMTSTNMAADVEPPHFWRRAFAFLLDLLLAQLVVSLLFTALDTATGTSLDGSSSSETSQCSAAPASHPQVVRVEGMWPLPAGWQRENVVCHYGSGADERWTFTTRLVRQDGTMTYRKSVTYDIDKEGKAMRGEFAPDFQYFAIVILFVALAASRWRTPGKSMMSLQVTGEDGVRPGWRHTGLREFLKLMPLTLFGLFAVWISVAPPRVLTDSEVSLVAMRDGALWTSPWTLFLIGWCGFVIVWCIGPFLRWPGRTWYDAVAGTKLIRTESRRASGPRRP